MKTENRNNSLPISAIVCTLNEENNIVECLTSIEKNKPSEIIVIDGSSEDRTVEKATEMGVKVSVCERKGLAYQRYIGAEIAQQPYIAFIDADDVLDSDCLKNLMENLQNYECSVVQAISRSYSSSTYWERAMESLNHLRSRKPGPTNMVGRPALYRKDVLMQVGIDKYWGRIGNEDTDLAIRFEKQNQKMRIGDGYSARKHSKTLKEWLHKWAKYGKGDAKLIIKYPDKRTSIFHHQLINYPLKLSFEAVKKGYGKYVPFYVLFGLARFVFMIARLIQLKWQQQTLKTSGFRKQFIKTSH